MKERRVCWSVRPEFCIMLAFALLLIPAEWVFAWLFSTLIHELGHAVAILFSGGEIYSICLGASGMKMEVNYPQGIRQLICALAGPAAGLCLCLMANFYPEAAICAFIHSVYNLFPIYPLDGGRALRCMLEFLLDTSKIHTVEYGVKISVFAVLLFAAVYLSIMYHLVAIPVLIVLALYFRLGK